VRIQASTALYVGNGCTRQDDLDSHLQSIGIGLHKVFSVQAAKQKLCDHKYSLLLIKFEHVRRHIFDLCTVVRQKNCESVILVLMDNPHPIIESALFDFGVDDIAVGKQTFPSVLKFRIKKRIFNNRSPLPDTNRILLKGGVNVVLDRKEVWFNKSCRMIGGILDKLFRYFLENPHRVISRAELVMSNIWDNSVCPPSKEENGKAIDMAITRLRRIIEPNPSNPQIIITVHRIGWMLASDAVILPPPPNRSFCRSGIILH
jgi:two-component system torCAD operon response regulator TorR